MKAIKINGKIIKGSAFDMDGTLIDCSYSRVATQNVAGAKYQIDWSQCGGRGISYIYEWLRSQYADFNHNKNDFISECHAAHANNLDKLSVRLGMLELLELFHKLDLPIAVVTNTDTAMAKMRLNQCGILTFVDLLIGSDTIIERRMKFKPAPDGYLLAANEFACDGNQMIGFEDSLTGMQALQATRFMTVHIYDDTIAPIPNTHLQINAKTDADMLEFINMIKEENQIN